MNGSSFRRLAAFLAVFVGLGGIAYAILFAFIVAGTSPQVFRAWLILGILGGLAATGVFVALYQHLRETDAAMALWALLLGVMAAIGQVVNAAVALGHELNPAVSGSAMTPDPLGVLRFGLNGLALFLFGSVLIRDRGFPKALGYLAALGGLLLVVIYLLRLTAVIDPTQHVTLIPPFLYGFLVHPILYVWLGGVLARPGIEVAGNAH